MRHLTTSLLTGCVALCPLAAATITIDAIRPGAELSPSLYGIFFEEINHGGEGGLYGELLINRSFEETLPIEGTVFDQAHTCCVGPNQPHYLEKGRARYEGKPWAQPWFTPRDKHPGWTVEGGDADVKIDIARTDALNPAQAQYLTMTVKRAAAPGSVVRLRNDGFWGVPAKQGETYHASFWARTRHFGGAVTVGLIDSSGRVVGSADLTSVTAGEWTKYTATFTSNATDGKAKFFLAPHGTGELDLDVVSLFGSTYGNRPNGMRVDLVEKLKALKPAFLRFPGGCVVEGATLENRTKWKETIGPVEQRPGHWSLWNYRSTDGLGFHEYLELCEDLGASGMFVINVGISCDFRNGDYVTGDALAPFIQDALDAIEYATGPVTSTWGAKRAANGHPAPFPLKYIEIGNENHGPLYRKHYDIFRAALAAKHPELTYVLNTWDRFHGDDATKLDDLKVTQPIDLIDEHYYEKPDWFFAQYHRYDNVPRNRGYGSYLGEYASNNDVGNGNHLAALAEAAFMLGMERNGDVVKMASYAPLFFNVNKLDWKVNLIGYDNLASFGRSSYWVQQMYAQNKPDVNLTTTIDLGVDAQARIYAQAGLIRASNEVVIKLVNATDSTVPATLALNGLSTTASQATRTVLAGDPTSENSIAHPDLIAPRTNTIPAEKQTLTTTLAPWSVTVLRVPTK
jgi:alpha-N-arabinofuranosidase